MDKMKIYNRIPIKLQNLACNLESKKIKNKRYNKNFWKKLTEYEQRTQWSNKKLHEYQNMRLQLMISHCYNSVPYYRELLDTLSIRPEDINTIDDLKKLPILTKEVVLDRFDDFISTNINRKDMIWSHTNGTTGSGFKFLTTEDAVNEQWAVWWRYRRKLGISFDTKCAIFGGKIIVPITQKNPPFWRDNRSLNQVYFSIYHLGDESIEHYLRDLVKLNIEWIHGYPSAIALIAQYIINSSISVKPKIKFITIGSENLLEHQEKLIETAFGVKPYQHYGLAEGVSNISENNNNELIVDEDFSVTEFVDINGQGLHIIGTSLTNFAMPFLRYNTKDIVVLPQNNKSSRFPRVVESIDGRKEDYIVLSNGRKIGRLAHIFADIIEVREAQIYQYEVDKIEVRIVKGFGYSEIHEKQIERNIRDILGVSVELFFCYLETIERTKGGKLRFVISDVMI